MALILGDVHGYYEKLQAFLQYKPEEDHLITGDHLDSYIAYDEKIIKTFSLFVESSALSVIGNHDITYLTGCPPELSCSGHRPNPVFIHLMNQNKDRFKGSIIRDGYIITHGGVVASIGNKFDNIEDLSEYINAEMDKVIHNPVGSIIDRPLSDVFHISVVRGGLDDFGGPLWADYRREKLDIRFNQIFGHSHSDKLKIMQAGKAEYNVKHVAVDCAEWKCFNTITGEAEDFMFEKYRDDLVVRRMLEVRY